MDLIWVASEEEGKGSDERSFIGGWLFTVVYERNGVLYGVGSLQLVILVGVSHHRGEREGGNATRVEPSGGMMGIGWFWTAMIGV